MVQFFQDQDANDNNFVGSGFAIAPGWILTCQHVLDGCDGSIWMKPSDNQAAEEITGRTYQIQMNNGKRDLDLVLVPCKSELPASAKLGIGLDRKFWVDDLKNQNCRVQGGLYREQRTITEVTQQATTIEGLPTEVQVMGGVVEGFSGSPVVININGEEIAIGVAYHGGQGVNHSRIFLLDPVVDFISNRYVQGLLDTELNIVFQPLGPKLDIRKMIVQRRFEAAVEAMREICDRLKDRDFAQKTLRTLTGIEGQVYQIREDENGAVGTSEQREARKIQVSTQMSGILAELDQQSWPGDSLPLTNQAHRFETTRLIPPVRLTLQKTEPSQVQVRFAVLVFLLDRDNRLLLVQHPFHNRLIPPGGRLKDGEVPHQSVRERLLEETGITEFEFHPDFHSPLRVISEVVESVPEPYSVHMEHRRQRDGITSHYAFVYVCRFTGVCLPVTGEASYRPQWYSLGQIKSMPRDRIPFDDIVRRYEGIIELQGKVNGDAFK